MKHGRVVDTPKDIAIAKAERGETGGGTRWYKWRYNHDQELIIGKVSEHKTLAVVLLAVTQGGDRVGLGNNHDACYSKTSYPSLAFLRTNLFRWRALCSYVFVGSICIHTSLPSACYLVTFFIATWMTVKYKK